MATKILIPTDFSSNAWHAVCYALELFKHKHCEIHIINVFGIAEGLSVFMYPQPGDEDYESAKFEAQTQLSKLADKITLRLQGETPHKINTVAICGEPLDIIKEYSQTNGFDLIVMGTQGLSNTGNAVYGSVAVNVMEKVRNCPVLVVPQTSELTPPLEIVLPTKLTSSFTQGNLKILGELLLMHECDLKILHILKNVNDTLNNSQTDNLKTLTRILNLKPSAFKKLHNIDVLSGINCFIESRDSSMVTFLNKRHAFFGSILSKPLVKQITFYSKVPILVLHE